MLLSDCENVVTSVYKCMINSLSAGIDFRCQTDRYFIDRKKVNPDLFGIEIRVRYVHVYTAKQVAPSHVTMQAQSL